jgi:hypothetical protein
MGIASSLSGQGFFFCWGRGRAGGFGVLPVGRGGGLGASRRLPLLDGVGAGRALSFGSVALAGVDFGGVALLGAGLLLPPALRAVLGVGLAVAAFPLGAAFALAA